MIHSSGGLTKGPMGFERPGSSGASMGFRLRAGVMSTWNCTKHTVSGSWWTCRMVCRESSSEKYLESLRPRYRCLWLLILYLPFVDKAVESLQSDGFQVRRNCPIKGHVRQPAWGVLGTLSSLVALASSNASASTRVLEVPTYLRCLDTYVPKAPSKAFCPGLNAETRIDCQHHRSSHQIRPCRCYSMGTFSLANN